MLGPVFWMEMRTRSRRRVLFVIRTLAAVGLSTVLAVVYFNFHWDTVQGQHVVRQVRNSSGKVIYARARVQQARVGGELGHTIQQLARLGGELFRAYAVAQFVMLLLITPVYCAGAIAGERERRALDLVFLTRMNNLELIAGKFFVRVAELLMVGTTGLPALFLCLLLGGVSWQGLLIVGALTVVLVLFIASVSLLVSIFAARILSAVVLVYMILLTVWGGFTAVAGIYVANQAGLPLYSFSWFLFALNPAVAATYAIAPPTAMQGQGNNPFPGAQWWSMGFYSLATLLFLALSVAIVRRAGLWASRERSPRRTRWQERQAARKVWENPVAWREVKTIAVHRRMRWARIMALVMLWLVSAPVWLSYLVDLIERGHPLPSDLNAVNMTVCCTAVVTGLLMTLQGSMSFAYERDRSTLDALLTTPLVGREIVVGKLAGILRSSAFALAFPLVFLLVAWLHGVMSGRAAFLGTAIVLCGALLASAWGLLCSVQTATAAKAATRAFTVALVLLIGLPAAMGMTLRLEYQRQFLPVALSSPSFNLSYAISETPSHTTPSDRWASGLPYQKWADRLWFASAYTALSAVGTVWLSLIAIKNIDRRQRVGPPRREWRIPRRRKAV